MALRNPQLDWDRLLDGGTYTLNLDDIGWQRGLNDLRAKIHYEADRRRGVAYTHKVDAVTLEFHCVGARVNAAAPAPIVRPAGNCTCGAGTRGPHVITCAALKDWPTPLLDPDHPDYVPPQDQPSTPTSEPLEADDEALLGPCTCGQSPQCLPDCSRVTGLAA